MDAECDDTGDLQTAEPAAPNKAKPRRKYKRRAVKAAAPKAEKVKASDEFPGLSPTECCNTCHENRCVISGVARCAHPFKGGLPSNLRGDHAALKRYGRAEKTLEGQKLNID